jgi:CubicO group peptidase (beta-lactamase class C family)/D-alanyl-D-alanine dipeptidase
MRRFRILLKLRAGILAGAGSALLLLAAAARAQQAPYSELESFIRHEMADKRLPALGIALVDDQRIVWQRAFGASEHAVYRAGAVSTMFTGVAVMQLVERGELDLDAPVSKYLPTFNKPVTLRQLMCSRSGLVREPPVGHDFDDTGPTLAATVASLNQTGLVYPPGAHEKYSNSDAAVLGYLVERTQKQPFAQYVERAVLAPLGMTESSFEPSPTAKSFLWTYDGRLFATPTFRSGTAPAAGLYSTTGDLAKFLSALFAGGRGILRRDTLEQMSKPQFDGDSGLGFDLDALDGRRRIGRGGAIFGFTTDVRGLPDDKLGAVVVTTVDGAGAVVGHIAREALRAMLASRQGKPAPPIAQTEPVPVEEARRLEGQYPEFDLTARDGKLFIDRRRGGKRAALRKLDGDLITDDLTGYGEKITPLPARLPDRKPQPAPLSFRNLVGEYGRDYDTLYILERDGNLTALVDWHDYYPLIRVNGSTYRFPAWGLYDNETLTFRFDSNGRAVEARVSEVAFKRRAIGPESGGIFRIRPRRPLDQIRREAQSQTPPAETARLAADLVDLTTLDPKIKLDIRYAGTDNFLSSPLYTSARAFMQRPAAEALARAHHNLERQGYGLLIHDAYRPWYVTKMFWEATPDDKRIFVANPAEGSRHNRGCAVDLTIYDLATGRPIEMVGVYDEMSERSYPDYPGGTSLQRWHRALLRHAMEAEGFTVYEVEWWHFDYKDWNRYAIGNIPFEQIRIP